MSSAFKRIAQVLLLAVGAALLIMVLRRTGTEKLKEILPALAKPGSWAVFLFYLVMNFWDTVAWQVLVPVSGWRRRAAQCKDLFLIRLAGEAVNGMTPFIDVGGEFLKAALASDVLKMSKKNVVTSVVLARTTLFFSEIMFWIWGLLPAFWMVSLSPSVRWGLGTTTVIFIVLAAALLFLQRRGFFSTIVGGFKRLGFGLGLAQKFHLSLKEIDGEITSFYRAKKGILCWSIFLHWIGWGAGGFETYLMFKILGSPLTFWQMMLGEALFQIVKTGSFFIPANLGAQEAGFALFAQMVGIHPSQGVLVSLLKRARQLLWAGVGFAIWGIYTIMVPSKSGASI